MENVYKAMCRLHIKTNQNMNIYKNCPFWECTKYSCKQTFAVHCISIYIYTSQSTKIWESLGIKLLHDESQGPQKQASGSWGRGAYMRKERLTFEEFLKHQTSLESDWVEMLIQSIEREVENADAYSDCNANANATSVPETRRSSRDEAFKHDVRHWNKAMTHSSEFMSKQK